VADFDYLASHAEALPNKPAVILGDRSLDFASLDRAANRAAAAIEGLGCVAGDRVAIMSFNSIEGFEIANGLRRASMVVVPVNYRLRGPEIAYVLNDSGARVVVVGPDHVDAVIAAAGDVKGDVRFVTLGERVPEGWLSYGALMKDAADQQPAYAVGDGLAASMIYTSGTTGLP
jgi:acyl-CoA synthetase (AMP-forming)/AMP-acid ligase II